MCMNLHLQEEDNIGGYKTTRAGMVLDWWCALRSKMALQGEFGCVCAQR